MVINVHAGHNPEGKVACGAVGILNESRENRIIKDKVIAQLRAAGHTVYDCTVDNGISQNDVLRKIVSKCNAHTADLDVSIHLNAGRNDYVGNGSTGGTEVFVYSTTAGALIPAQRVARAISDLGFTLRDDRIKDDVKECPQLYVLRETKAPAMLIETCFVDDKDDAELYDPDKMATVIVKGITGQTLATVTTPVTYVKDERLSNEEVAAKVYHGDYGSNPERANKLTAEGYDPSVIQEIVNREYFGMTTSNVVSTPTQVQCYPKYTGASGSIVTGLNEVGENSSFDNRKSIASKNGIVGYRGTAEQNTLMLNLLKAGTLVRP